ncbi:Protein of uncharacterised function (DUF3109) [Porphyromonas macacae]|uniref:Protein of uncharacterized function (DUF3109) n=1 Tax=Porphyromonas macacae TaxID=28115 RepID=A0A379EBC0_9PORP|nr:DUF3109 family protein [Porphyromonas macacae]SUB89975.1 Protein of uncharacterised function (DUF3109) [Porphyromonas macacae]
MIEIDDKIISEDILEIYFSCDYEKCKGVCCVEGESGAPLEEGETELIRKYLPEIKPYLSSKALEIIEKQGVSYFDEDGDEVTSIVNGKDCVFTTYDKNNNCLCAFEKLYRDGVIDFCKPLSCRLYPIRLIRSKQFTALNYHKWSICKCALKKGRKEGIPLYRFLKEPLIAAFGQEWYNKLETCAEMLKTQKKTLQSHSS